MNWQTEAAEWAGGWRLGWVLFGMCLCLAGTGCGGAVGRVNKMEMGGNADRGGGGGGRGGKYHSNHWDLISYYGLLLEVEQLERKSPPRPCAVLRGCLFRGLCQCFH